MKMELETFLILSETVMGMGTSGWGCTTKLSPFSWSSVWAWACLSFP